MKSPRSNPKSGQAIIFMMVVLVIGLFVVIWNYDLHRVISAKLRMRTIGDSAALAAARWQGMTLNMIGDLNLVQAALISADFQASAGLPQQPADLHELRARLDFVGPLAAFSVAQQTAFNNGAVHDEELADNLRAMAEYMRGEIGRQPYDNAREEYADLLDLLADNGVAVSSYALSLPKHPLVQKRFYAAVAQALSGWWCPFQKGRYKYLLESYAGYESWGKLDTEFKYRNLLDLRLNEFITSGNTLPDSSLASTNINEYLDELQPFLEEQDIILNYGDSGYAGVSMVAVDAIEWHVYDSSWERTWPRPAEYDEDTLAIRAPVKNEFNYLGAVAPIGISTPVSRGILGRSDEAALDLAYKAKAKAFGFLDLADPLLPQGGSLVPPNYFGFVFPVFKEVRLVHSDIGETILDAAFYRHITQHLEGYLDRGPSALDPDCSYCRLLKSWENLDRVEGLKWLDRADASSQNPCDPDAPDDAAWGEAGGGATGGS